MRTGDGRGAPRPAGCPQSNGTGTALLAPGIPAVGWCASGMDGRVISAFHSWLGTKLSAEILLNSRLELGFFQGLGGQTH